MRKRTISAKADGIVQELLRYSYNHQQIPEYMHEPLACYVADHTPTGDFLHALLCGDLFRAVNRADDKNILLLPVYAGFLFNYAPYDCYGTKAKVEAWLEKETVTA